jgi:hypothetical protein
VNERVPAHLLVLLNCLQLLVATCSLDWFVRILDYRCEDGLFPVSPSCVTITNPNRSPAVKHGLIVEICDLEANEKSTYLRELHARKPLALFIFQMKS